MLNIGNPLLKRILNGTAAAGSEQVLNIVIQLISVPLFLKFWGVTLYGEWILLFSFPSYLAISDLGFAKAAINSMTLSFARNDLENMNRFYHSCFLFMLFLGTIIFLGVLVVLTVFPLQNFLNLHTINTQSIIYIFIFLTGYILLYQQADLLKGVLSSSGRFTLAMNLVTIYRFVEFALVVVALISGYGPVQVAACYLIVHVIKVFNIIFIIKTQFNWLKLGLIHTRNYASVKIIREMIQPAFAFILLPVGWALRNQFPLFLIGTLFDPAVIVMYTTARTISNSGVQFIGVINKAITPEYATAYGQGNMELVKTIHHKSCNVTFWSATFLAILLLFFGKTVLMIWTHHSVKFDYLLFYSFLLSLILNSLWSTGSFLSYSINKHIKQSFVFLFANAIGCLLIYIFIRAFGFSYSALGIVISDLLMVLFVFHINSGILNETRLGFLNNIFRLPSFKSFNKITKLFYSS